MCNGESGRASQGGAVVVLKPANTPEGPVIQRELSLRLSDDSSNGTTTALLSGQDWQSSGGHIVIQ